MRKRKTFIAMGIFIAILVLGVGYAAVNNINLVLNGTANVLANADFTVEFDTTHEVAVTPTGNITWPDGDKAIVAGEYTDALKATMTVNLDATHTSATAVYKIVNKSADLKAKLEATITKDFAAADYLTVTYEFYKDEECTQVLGTDPVNANTGEAYLKVIVALDKQPASDITNEEFTITVTASPVDSENI